MSGRRRAEGVSFSWCESEGDHEACPGKTRSGLECACACHEGRERRGYADTIPEDDPRRAMIRECREESRRIRRERLEALDGR